MLITLIFAAIALTGIVVTVIWAVFKKLGKVFFSEFVGISLLVIGGFSTLICGAVVGYSKSESIRNSVRKEVKSLNERYVLLTDNEATVENKDKEISKYNKDVEAFLNKVATEKEHYKNPWINWFVCPEYTVIDTSAIQYIEI